MRLRLLFIIESLKCGGKERRLIELLKGISKNHDIHLILLSKNIDYSDLNNLNIQTHYFARNFMKDFMIFSKFYKILNNFNPQIVHCWDNIAALHFGGITRMKSIPFVNSMISSAPDNLSFFSKQNLSYKLAFSFSDIILSNSKAGLISFNVPRKKSFVINNGFNLERLKVRQSESEIRNKYSLNSFKIVGMVASFSKMKDYKSFVKSAELVLENRKDVIFMCVGDGPNLNEIISIISSENKPFFRFLGKIHDVESIINTFDIGVLSTFTEGISNSILEYMAFKKPVVATDGGGTNEIVIDNETGFLVGRGDFVNLAERVNFLLENPSVASDMGVLGYNRIKDEFSIKKMAKSTIVLYKKLIVQ